MARDRASLSEVLTGRVEALNHEGWGVVRAAGGSGKVTFVEEGGNQKPVQTEAKTNPDYNCPDAKRQTVKAQIAAYINAAPAAAKTAEPANKASAKK